MGLYGNMMTYFQGQFIDMVNFDMLSQVNSGFDVTKTRDGETVTPLNFRGCFHNIAGKEVKNSNGNLVLVISGSLWSDTELALGTFVKINGTAPVYRIKKNNGWNNQGGFFYYDIVQVVGDDGTITEELDFNLGEGDFS